MFGGELNKVRISLIPWEFIWLFCLLLGLISLVWTVWTQLRQRKFGWPKSGLFYLALILLIIIPVGLRLTNYRFKLSSGTSEATSLDHQLPDLVIREYEGYSIQDVYEASLRVAQQETNYGQPWTIIFAGTEEFRVARLEMIIPVFFYEDRMSVTIQPISLQAGLRVIAISVSESSNRDYGENARHIVQFYRALDAELAKLPQN